MNFRGSIVRLRYSLHTLRAALTERLRNARFRLVASLCRVGVVTHWVSIVPFIMLRLHKFRYTGFSLSRHDLHGKESLFKRSLNLSLGVWRQNSKLIVEEGSGLSRPLPTIRERLLSGLPL